MKYSFYNYVFQNGAQSILYNAGSDGIILLQEELVNLVQKYKDNITELEKAHPDLYKQMQDYRMIVEDGTNEADSVIAEWKKEDNDPSVFYLTILPTLNCNLRCWYCYEEHKPHHTMKEDVLERVKLFLKKKVSEPELKTLYLDFFGGEPLLPFNHVVAPILDYVAPLSRQNNVRLFVNLVTNGVLLTADVIGKLKSLDLESAPGFQITLDGNRKLHDNSRHTASKGPTYDIIVKNIRAALSAGLSVNVRFNYTARSVDSFIDVLDDFKDVTEEERSILFFDFQQVWQESHLTEVREKAMKLAAIYQEQKFQVRIEKRYNSTRCRDDAENQSTISCDALVYKCTARDITTDFSEGVLNEEGDIVWNEKYHKRMAVKYGNDTCKSCKIFPICHGGCSQTKLEAGEEDKCIMNMSEQQKGEVIAGRLKYLLQTRRSRY